MSNIATLIDTLGEKKKVFDPMKKDVESLINDIKSEMLSTNNNYIETDSYTATVTARNSESFNEEKLIDAIEHMTYTTENNCKVAVGSGLGIIKMKPYVDMDALEDAIYRGLISDEDLIKLDACKVTKTSYALTVKKKKEKK